jgi:hypothetical protein
MSKVQLAQDFIILCLCAGVYIPPRRSLNYRKMQELTPVKLNQRLNKKFNGKKVGVSML